MEPAFVVSTERKRINPRSQGNLFQLLNIAIVFESRLQEVMSESTGNVNINGPSRQRINTVFAILDELNPFLGPFSNLVKELRNELYISVFSNSLTCFNGDLERIPYFSAINRIKELKREEIDKIQETIKDLSQRIKFRDQDINILQRKNLDLKYEIDNHLKKEQELELKIKDLENLVQLKGLEEEDLATNHLKQEQELQKEISSLTTLLSQANHVIDKLTVFKSNASKESDKKLSQEEKDALKTAVVIDPQGMIEYDLYQMDKVDEQLLEIMNLQIDDFDSALAQLKKKKEILSNVGGNLDEREAAHQVEVN